MVDNIYFSVLIPNYGFSHHLIDCLNSIVNQKQNSFFSYEIVLYDQSENDVFLKIKSICKDRYKKDIRLIHSDVKGVYLARHSLINAAAGKYIVFIDSDDYVDEDYLLTIFNELQKKDIDILITHWKYCGEDGVDSLEQQVLPSDISTNLMDYFLFTDYLNSIWAKIFKRELYNKLDYISYDDSISNGDDFIISLPLMRHASTISFCPFIKKYHYRTVQTSITHHLTFEGCKKTLNLRNGILSGIEMNSFQKALRLGSLLNNYSSPVQVLIRTNNITKKDFFDLTFDVIKIINEEKLFGVTLDKKRAFLFNLIVKKRLNFLWFIFWIRSKK